MKREWIDETESLLTEICDQYEKSAPTVCEWANDLYMRLQSDADKVVMSEICAAFNLRNPEWMHPNYAANTIYKLMSRLGQDTTGHTGF